MAIFHFQFQLFRRVAAALPGMDSTENKPPEDSILFTKNSKILTNFTYYLWSLLIVLFIRSYEREWKVHFHAISLIFLIILVILPTTKNVANMISILRGGVFCKMKKTLSSKHHLSIFSLTVHCCLCSFRFVLFLRFFYFFFFSSFNFP